MKSEGGVSGQVRRVGLVGDIPTPVSPVSPLSTLATVEVLSGIIIQPSDRVGTSIVLSPDASTNSVSAAGGVEFEITRLIDLEPLGEEVIEPVIFTVERAIIETQFLEKPLRVFQLYWQL